MMVLLTGLHHPLLAQTNIGLRSYVTLIDAIRAYKPIEKLYLQTDKPYYTLGDTIRLKAYLLKADYLTPTNRSGMLYVELDDQEGKPAKRMMLPVTQGLAWADIALDEKEVPHGSYTLRAYTNWMRNFGEEYIFKKDIYVSPATGNATLIKANFKQDGNKVETTLQFTSLDGKPLLVKDMELKVMDGRKNLSKDQLNTGMGGTLNANFELPPTTTGPITLQAKDVTKGTTDAATLTIPVTINRPENTDLQFMPEGGNLVAGIKTKVGFKAIAEDGKGIHITGKILNSKQQEVASFKTSHAGMGNFEFTPQQNESYVAKINNITKSYTLPIVNPTGTTLKVEQNISSDSLTITVTTNQPLNSTNTNYNLIGQSRGVVCFVQTVSFNNSNSTHIFKAARSAFPTGIARFTLINASHQPVNERQVFINRNDQLDISITAHKPNYDIRDSIALAIQVKDKDGKPVEGNFSLAVTDDSQVKTDSLSSNILNNLLLTSDLKGNIEMPNYYFINPNQKQTELDNLMLTQGWVGYDWKEVLYPSTNPIAYQPETEFTINGTVTNALNKPIEKSNVVLFSQSPFMVKDTVTDKAGRFHFKNIFPVDTAIFKLQARNKNGKEFNVGITMDEVKPPEFASPIGITPWYVNSDSIRVRNTGIKSAQQKAIANYRGEGHMMKEVTIREKKIIKGSKNLNGPGEADLIIDEEEIKKFGKKTLAELLRQKLYNFDQFYISRSKIFRFIFDGIDIDFFNREYVTATEHYFYQKSYVDYFTAEDIVGIEVIIWPKYAAAYDIRFKPQRRMFPEYFISVEITTRSKHGPFMKVTPGTYLHKTLAFTLPKQFYSPKYTVKNKTAAMGTDMRSTLHWEPNVITNAAGKATVSFFTADKPANYTIIIEGFTGEGEIGYSREKVKSTIAK